MRKLAALILLLPLAACSSSSGSGESAACDEFVRISATIESGGPDAGVANQLQQIADQAGQDGQDAVAQAAQDFLAAQQSDSTGDWYAALGAMEAACAPFGD